MYGLEIRKHVLKLIDNGKSQSEVANFLDISLKTIHTWVNRIKKGISLEPQTHVAAQER